MEHEIVAGPHAPDPPDLVAARHANGLRAAGIGGIPQRQHLHVRRGIEATTSVNRKDFGLLWEFPGEGAGVVVGDNIRITIDAELVLQPEPSKGG